MTFDIIIIGAGSAGCVLADRLSRDGRRRVLLLEAGSDNRSPLISMPRGMAKIWQNPRYYWSFPVRPQPMRPPGETWYYGKGLGGSSAVNGTWYYRGQPSDYDVWRAENPLWGWAEIERAYAEIEDYRGEGGYERRGRGGPLEITAQQPKGALSEAIVRVGQGLGIPYVEDVNTPGQAGVGPTQMTVDHGGRRVTAYTAFLRDAAARRNLTIMTGVTVRRVLLDGTRTTGVLCSIKGQDTIFTSREVILSAGVLQSPKLLQLSGIGPEGLLAEHGIPVVHANAAVGANMAEHIMMSLAYRLKTLPGHNREFRGWRLMLHSLRYFVSRKGLMASLLPDLSIMASSNGDPRWPDMQLGISPYSMSGVGGKKVEAGRGKTDRDPGISIVGFFLRPLSRGKVTIQSGDVADPPLVDAAWLSDPADVHHLVSLIATMRRFMHHPALADYVGEELLASFRDPSDEELATLGARALSTGLHGTGTCRMGKPGQNSVVDERSRVHGVTGLRVVDCSIMPTAISGNTNGPAMAVAWHAANLILEDLEQDAA